MEMTNGVTNATLAVEAQALPLESIVTHDPISWASFLLLALWLAAVLLIVSGIVRGTWRRSRGESTESLSIFSLVISTCVLFLGGGVILWSSASALEGLAVWNVVPTKTVMQLTVLRISGALRLLAINGLVAGAGFVAALLLKDKRPAEAQLPSPVR